MLSNIHSHGKLVILCYAHSHAMLYVTVYNIVTCGIIRRINHITKNDPKVILGKHAWLWKILNYEPIKLSKMHFVDMASTKLQSNLFQAESWVVP